ncbi:hypothetical protein ACTJLB_02670 [Paraburkholderia sp. 22098]|uniref:hypothetical protein n=1 Tax=Paraburkholderia sp. 22098 TaxID=3453874 RepID=UPI003F87C262
MTEQIFIPVQQYLESLWPASIVELPKVEAFEHVWMEPLNVQTNPDITVATGLLFETSVELGVPGLDAVKLVIAPSGTATSFMLKFQSAPMPSISLVSVPVALRLHGDLLRAARKGAPDSNGVEVWEVDPTRPFVDIQLADVTLTFDFDGNISVQAGFSIDLPPVMIGDSGIAIEAQDIGIFLDSTAPPPGKPAGWKGVHIAHGAVHLPAGLSGSVGTLSMDDAFIGNGGFSGSVAVDFAPALSTSLFGMDVTLVHAGLAFTQNALTGSDIRGTLALPFFDAPVDISIALGLDGSFAVALGGGNGLVTLTKPGIIELSVDSLGFAVDKGRFVVRLSGGVRPLLGGLDWPQVEVRELSIDSDGHVHIDGGWLDLRDGYHLNLAGFGFEITRLGFGSTDDGARWLGFSGALKLVDGMSAGASVEGLRVSWYDDGRPPALTLNGVGVEFVVPDVLRFQGEVSMRDLPGGVRRFDGAIKLQLTTLDMEIDGQLVVGTAGGRSFFAIYLGAELPVGIPLWTTGLGLYGIAGLFALEMEPDKAPDEPWYGVAPGEGWYKKPQVGVTDLVKWRNQAGSLGLGAGVTLGTLPDNGFTFAGRMLLAIVFPGPILMIEGKANLLKERSALSDDPLFRALAVIDGREGTFLVGLDIDYKFADAAELIEISGGMEAFFSFHDPMAWHLYLGERDPRERRIRAEIFKLFESNAYLMLDAHQLGTGAFVGYDGHWTFGPVRASLEAWIEGNAGLPFKPPHFHGDLWLHGRAELRVFGFGFDISADARAASEVFDPFLIKMDVSAHLGLPWPLPDFDVSITLQWGPEPVRPPLPMPLKDVAIGHNKVTTTWPLPRTVAPALLAPNYDPDNDGFLGDPDQSPATVAAAPPPPNAPVIPLDARPQISFGRNVNDDALVGINPQPVFPDAHPDPGWEWIGDPARNEGPVRIRTAIREVVLDRWQPVSATWAAVARRGPGNNEPGVQLLYGAWAPMPQLPGGAPGAAAPAAQTKLSLWSRSAFDYLRHSSAEWSDWWTATMADYPCVPIPPDEEVCCYLRDLAPGSYPRSPWRCPGHPEFALGWPYPVRPTAQASADDTMLCFPEDSEAELRLGRSVKRVRLFIATQSRGDGRRQCLDFGGTPQRTAPNPYVVDGLTITVRDFNGATPPNVQLIQTGTGQIGLDLRYAADVVLPATADAVSLTIRVGGGRVEITALRDDGVTVDRIASAATGQQTLMLSGDRIARIAIRAPSGESLLFEICAMRRSSGLQIVGIDHEGRESGSATLQGGVAELDGRDLASVRIRGEGLPFCISGFCVVVGLSKDEQLRREQMSQHLLEETAHWQAAGDVLLPYTQYRLRIVTTLETRGFAYDPTFNTTREHTEFSYFRTSGPPGLAALSQPIASQAPAEAAAALADLTLYVRQTTPPTVPGAGQKPALPRPVYRAYDVGVDFNEDYVDLLYRLSGRDLNIYLFDSNNRPARDIFGKLLVAPTSWSRAETLALSRTDTSWVDLVNASTCAKIEGNKIVKPRKLRLEGQVLLADTRYEARLIPLLLHETFADMGLGQSAIGTGAPLPGPGGGWVVADAGASDAPSHWTIVQDGMPPTRYVEQQSNIWGGPDIATNPTNPGTILLRASDPALPPDHPDQPANWTDYRITAVLRPVDNDAIGLAFRYRDADEHYLFAMDRERSYRRIVRVAGGTYTIVAAEGTGYPSDADLTITIEVVGARIRVYEDGGLLFDVADGAHPTGGIGLYCWAMQGARFADVRVDDLRAAAPVVYHFSFTTSRFADFFHQIGSGSGRTWRATLADDAGLAAGVAAALPCAGLPAAIADSEWRAYATLAEKIVGPAARQDTDRMEATAGMLAGGVPAVLLRTAEPIDWARTTLAVHRAAGAGPAFAEPADAVPATAPIRIADWSPAPAGPPTPAGESVTLLLDEDADPDGWRVQYRTLASADAPDLPDGQLLFEDPFLGIVESAEHAEAQLFDPPLTSLAGFSVKNPPASPINVPSQWSAAGGIVKQVRLTGTPAALGGAPFAMLGTHLVSNTAFHDARIEAVLRSAPTSGAFGMVFRYVDELNYYRFSLSTTTGRRLIRRKGGVITSLWNDNGAVTAGADHALVIDTVGGAIRVTLDGLAICAVRDTAIGGGQVGFYTWRCNGASFRALDVHQLNQVVGGWTIVEFGNLAVGSLWRSEGAALKQVAPIAPTPVIDPTVMGSYAVAGDGAWTDVRVKLRIVADPADASGVALRWQGPDDHVLLLLDSRSGHAKLLRRSGGMLAILGDRAVPLVAGQRSDVVLEAIGTRLRAWLDGAPLFDVHDASLASGSVALFAAATGGAGFARLRVESARPDWLPYATLTGVGLRAAGRRLRLFAGREADVTAPSVTGEVCSYQNFLAGDTAGIRLPAEGVDLRLLDPSGAIAHARRFAPDEAFVPASVSTLRAADGTGLIMMESDAAAPGGTQLSPGIYRLTWLYRRDNSIAVPGSGILSEHGDTGSETATLDVYV